MTDRTVRPTLTFLLRLWAEPNGGCWQWRVQVTGIGQGAAGQAETAGFGSLGAAIAFVARCQEQAERRADARPDARGDMCEDSATEGRKNDAENVENSG